MQELRTFESKMVGNSNNNNANSNVAAEVLAREQSEMKKELRAWRDALQLDLKREAQQELQSIEDRMSSALLAEKRLLDASAKSLHNLNAADPALLAVVEDALVVAESKRVGRVDHAALVNGASVVYSERCASCLAGSICCHALMPAAALVFAQGLASSRRVPIVRVARWICGFADQSSPLAIHVAVVPERA